MKLTIPPIYEENIIGFVQQNGDCIFEYLDKGNLFRIVFTKVYAFDFVEFDYMKETDWQFGLELQENPAYLQQMMQEMPKEIAQKAFGGEYEKMQQYKLVIDDVGSYNIVCKDINAGYAKT